MLPELGPAAGGPEVEALEPLLPLEEVDRFEAREVGGETSVAVLLPAGPGMDEALVGHRVEEGVGDSLVARDRRMDVVHEPVGAENAARAEGREEPWEVHNRRAGLAADLQDDPVHRRHDPQGADIQIAGTFELQAGFLEAPEVLETLRQSVVETGVLVVDGQGAAEQGDRAGKVLIIGVAGRFPEVLETLAILRRQAGAVLRLERWRIKVVHRVDQDDGHARAPGQPDHPTKIEFIMCNHTLTPLRVTMVGGQAIAVVEDRVHLRGQGGAAGGFGAWIQADEMEHGLAGEDEASQPGEPFQGKPERIGGLLDRGVGAVFKELVMPRAEDEQIRLMLQ